MKLYGPPPELPPMVLNEAAVEYSLSRQQMAAMLGVSDKTFYNILKSNTLESQQADRFLFMKNILDEGRATFNGPENFRGWLHSEQSVLGSKKPVDLLASLNGAQEVLATITRIKHGIFA
jgi:putative toxin-antitoxin system antitoxin component (TIGR02293 family)